MMKLLLLLALVPVTVYAADPSVCRQCGGLCVESCSTQEIELGLEDPICKAQRKMCCVPEVEIKCYDSGGTCLTERSCTEEGSGTVMSDSSGFCTTILNNPRYCCVSSISSSCTLTVPPESPASACSRCGGICAESCGTEEVELGGDSPMCKAGVQKCCVPNVESSCYSSGGGCITERDCLEMESGVVVSESSGFCTIVLENVRSCCVYSFSPSCTLAVPSP